MEYTKGEATKLSANFVSTEFDCKGASCGCTSTKISKQLITYLQLIRNHFGKPVSINSGFRCQKHNSAVGGAKGSKHTLGQAADIVVSGVAPKEVAKYAESIGIKGIGLYDTFVHIDTRTAKFFWYGHGQEQRTTFIEGATNYNLFSQEQNPVLKWQLAAIADGFSFATGADGKWGEECAAVAKRAIVKKRANYLYPNLTKIVQKAVGADVDGKCGEDTKAAIKKYQKQKGLKQDGEVGLNTWKAILG